MATFAPSAAQTLSDDSTNAALITVATRRRTEIEEIYQKLRDLVADGSLSAAVEHVYPLDQFKEAFRQSLKSNRGGKILFKF